MKTRCGTKHYKAPEIYRKEPYGLACDMWSLGVTIYAIVTGYLPFNGKNREELEYSVLTGQYDKGLLYDSGVSQMCVDFISQLLNQDPSRRMTAEEALAHPWLSMTDALADLSSSIRSLRSSIRSSNPDSDINEKNEEEDEEGCKNGSEEEGDEKEEENSIVFTESSSSSSVINVVAK